MEFCRISYFILVFERREYIIWNIGGISLYCLTKFARRLEVRG